MRRTLSVILATLALSGAAVVASAHHNEPTRTDVATVRALNGVPPCYHEDGSGQPGACVWLGLYRGNHGGDDILFVPTRPGQDKRATVLVNR